MTYYLPGVLTLLVLLVILRKRGLSLRGGWRMGVVIFVAWPIALLVMLTCAGFGVAWSLAGQLRRRSY